MDHLDFSYVLSSTLTPITLISGVGLLLMTMSARYAHTTDRVRQMVVAHADGIRVPAYTLQSLGNTPRAHAAHSVQAPCQ